MQVMHSKLVFTTMQSPQTSSRDTPLVFCSLPSQLRSKVPQVFLAEEGVTWSGRVLESVSQQSPDLAT